MVNWIVDEPINPRSAHLVAGKARCLATIGPRNRGDRPGSVEFRPSIPPAVNYLLTHSLLELDESEIFDQARSGIIERYSLTPGGEWWAGDVRGAGGCYRFRAYHQGVYCTEVRLRVPGTHQVLPALAAVAIAARLELSPRVIKDRLEEFSGIPRGFESRGTFRGATLVDDEALGVDAIGETLKLAREVFGRRTVRVVYLPHDRLDASSRPSASEFIEANQLILIDSATTQGESTRLLAASLRSSGASVAECSSVGKAIQELDRSLEPGDVVITLGAGEVGTIADAFLRRLSRDRHG